MFLKLSLFSSLMCLLCWYQLTFTTTTVNREALLICMYFDEQELETVQILADALPKIVPYVLINHREVLYPSLF